MTTFGTYDAGLPCKNANCKSHGRPHPNCHCYGNDMAKGGEVKGFCSKDRRHESGCEYHINEHPDPQHSVASYLASEGLHNLINFGSDESDDALEKYNGQVKKGTKHFDKINHLFEGKLIESQDHTKSKKKIHEWMAKGGIIHELQEEIHEHHHRENFADGGKVSSNASPVLHHHPLAEAYPEQNVMLQAAKGRMSNYLNTLKPQENAQKLAFDAKPDDRAQKKSYQKALHLAAHPLSILEEVQKGTILPEDITHLKNLHPEVNEILQRKLTERVTKDQLENKKPSYKVRQGLSLLLGAPLSSDMSQSNMQAIQATFQSKQQQPQEGAPTKNVRKTSTLTKVDDAYLTGNQARVSRQQKQ